MTPLEAIDIDLVTTHLQRMRSPVRLPFTGSGYRAYRGRLEAADRERLVLWWQFRRRTRNESCRVADLLPEVPPHRRTLAFLHGDPARGTGPVDLRRSPGLEIVLLASHLASRRLYIIDGNNRVVAQQRAHDSFEGVPFYLGVHPELAQWDQMPNHLKRP